MQFFQQVGCCLLGFLAGDVLAHGFALPLFGRTCFAYIGELDDVSAELGAYGSADLAGR